MYKENSMLRGEARAALQGKWTNAVLVTLVYFIVVGGICHLLGYLLPYNTGDLVGFLITLPIVWSFNVGFLDLFRKRDLNIKNLFDGFSDFQRIFTTQLLVSIYSVLWSLLLIIPGIVKSYSYAMTPYILKDDPQISNNQAIEKSMEMMNGNKMKLFLLDLSFIGWFILAIMTFGVGILLLAPYIITSHAAFYENLKQEQRL